MHAQPPPLLQSAINTEYRPNFTLLSRSTVALKPLSPLSLTPLLLLLFPGPPVALLARAPSAAVSFKGKRLSERVV